MTAPMTPFRRAELRMLADGGYGPYTNLAALAEALDEIDRLEAELLERTDECRALRSLGSHNLMTR